MVNEKNPDQAAQAFGGIYARFMMDHIVELATRLAFDVSKHPAQFDLPYEISEILESFRTRVGKHPDWPDSSQRGALFDLSLGLPFTAASAAFRLTALRFAETGTDATRTIHGNALLDAAHALRDLLEPTTRQAERTSYRQLSNIFGQAVRVLQSAEVRRGFGYAPSSDENWPLKTPSSPGESRLLDEVLRTTGQASCQAWGQNYFSTIQRVAYFGRLTLDSIMSAESLDENWTRQAFDHGYRWTRALQDLLSVQTIIRSWKEPAFRLSLTEAQRRHLPPNPAGEVDTTNANLQVAVTPQAGQTFTVHNEVCCSTTPSVSCMSHCPRPELPEPIIVAPSTYPCCSHHC